MGVRKPELFLCLRTLGLIAGMTRQGQITDPIRAATTLGNQMFNLQRNIPSAAVQTGPAPLFEQILAHLVAQEGALLVLHAGDFRVLHLLRIELNVFGAQSGNGREFPDFRQGRNKRGMERRKTTRTTVETVRDARRSGSQCRLSRIGARWKLL